MVLTLNIDRRYLKARRALRKVYTFGLRGLPKDLDSDLDYALEKKLIEPERVAYAENVYLSKKEI